MPEWENWSRVLKYSWLPSQHFIIRLNWEFCLDKKYVCSGVDVKLWVEEYILFCADKIKRNYIHVCVYWATISFKWMRIFPHWIFLWEKMENSVHMIAKHTHTHTHTYKLTHIYRFIGSTLGVMFTVVVNDHEDPSSKHGRSCLHFI